MPPQFVDCHFHGRAPSIDPTTGRPPVYRKERFVAEEIHYNRAVYDPETKTTRAVPSVDTALNRVPYGPELPAGGGVCKLCWMQKGNTPATPVPRSERSVIDALADSLGLPPEQLRAKLRAELLGENPTP